MGKCLKKAFRITNKQGNANQNHNELSSHFNKNGHYQKDKRQQVLMRMWKKGNPCTLRLGMQITTSIMENSMEIPQKLKIELPYDPETPFLDLYPKEMKSVHQRDICTPMLIAALFIIAKK